MPNAASSHWASKANSRLFSCTCSRYRLRLGSFARRHSRKIVVRLGVVSRRSTPVSWRPVRSRDCYQGNERQRPAGPVSRPFHFRRHARQDGGDIAAGVQAEDGAPVVEQVELDIAAAAHELLLAVGGASRAARNSHARAADRCRGRPGRHPGRSGSRRPNRLFPARVAASRRRCRRCRAARFGASGKSTRRTRPCISRSRRRRHARRRARASRHGSESCRHRPGCAAGQARASGRRRRRTTSAMSPPCACSCERLAHLGFADGRSARCRSPRSAGHPRRRVSACGTPARIRRARSRYARRPSRRRVHASST